MAAHTLRIWGSRKYRITRHVTIAKDTNSRALLACLAHESLPRGPLADPLPADYTSRLGNLLKSYPLVTDVHTTTILHDRVSGLPNRLVSYIPSLQENARRHPRQR